jgi:hypothetical protein
MNLFEPPPPHPQVFTPRDVAKRLSFDLVLGVALGVGAACAFFAGAWVGQGPRDDGASVWFIFALFGVFACDALIIGVLRTSAGRSPWAATLLKPYGWLRTVAFAGFLVWLAWTVNQRLSQVVDRDFQTLVILAALLGVAWIAGIHTAWREARPRVTPWLVAGVSLYLAADWAVKLGPNVETFNDPRVNIAYYAIVGCGAYALCAILAFMDSLIAWRNRGSEANGNG